MSESPNPTFLVSPHTDPVIIKITGKANYLNCNAFREFLTQIIESGKKRIFVDCNGCQGMDSTFLGILAGTAIELQNNGADQSFIIGNLGDRNYESICNLGLQNLLTIERSQETCDENFEALDDDAVRDTKQVLAAHENLTKANSDNLAKFQDVISFLRKQVEDDSSDET